MKAFAPVLFASGYLITLVAAQTYPNINPDDYDIDTKNTWCTNQQAACPNLCQDQERVGASTNDCDPETLKYACVCENGKTPNMEEYSMSLPYVLCQQSIVKCRENCKGNSACADLCATARKCGATKPTTVNATTTISTTAGPTASKTASSTSNSDSGSFNTGTGSSLATSGVFAMVMAVAVGFGVFGLM